LQQAHQPEVVQFSDLTPEEVARFVTAWEQVPQACCADQAWIGYNDVPGREPFLFQCSACDKVIVNADTTRLSPNATWTEVHSFGDGKLATVGDHYTMVSHVAGKITYPESLLFGFPVPPTMAEACQDLPWPVTRKIYPSFLAAGVLKPTYRTRTLPLGWNLMYRELKRSGWMPAPNSLYWGTIWIDVKSKSVSDGYFSVREWVGRWPLPSPDAYPVQAWEMLELYMAHGYKVLDHDPSQ
jgi:hypothetical protein